MEQTFSDSFLRVLSLLYRAKRDGRKLHLSDGVTTFPVELEAFEPDPAKKTDYFHVRVKVGPLDRG